MEGQLFEWALSIGFPAWAVVVWAASMKVTGLIQKLADNLRESHADSEKRIVLLEKTVERLEMIAERQDERLRIVETHRD